MAFVKVPLYQGEGSVGMDETIHHYIFDSMVIKPSDDIGKTIISINYAAKAFEVPMSTDEAVHLAKNYDNKLLQEIEKEYISEDHGVLNNLIQKAQLKVWGAYGEV